MKRRINYIIGMMFIVIALILFTNTMAQSGNQYGIVVGAFALVLALIHFLWGKNDCQRVNCNSQNQTYNLDDMLTEVVLLGENDNRLASWNLYGQNGMVIGRDVGENNVTINLNECTFSSMIEIEHCVLNYSDGHWYAEDISEKNGVSIQKSDGKKYKLAYGKPCRLERGDILHIALTRLQIL